MATTTTYYGMSKPSLLEAADIRVINGDIDTIDRVMHSHMVSMAPVFDPSSTYDIGELVMYNDILYRCKTAISTASAWDATKWDATNIVDEFPEGGGGGIDYSTTEQNTGLKWIDGSDIYQRTLVVNNLSVENGVRFTLPHGIVNIGKMVSLECCMHTDETDFAGGVFLTPNASVFCTDTNISLSFPATWQASVDRVWYFTIQYTKTLS